MEDWGHEYVRHLSGEIVSDWNEMADQDKPEEEKVKKAQLVKLVRQLIPSQMKHHAEAEACDLLMEVEQLDLIHDYLDKDVYQRVCLYLTSCVPYVPDPENTNLLKTAMKIFRYFKQHPQVIKKKVMRRGNLETPPDGENEKS